MAQMLQQIRERAQHEGIALQHEVAGGQATSYVTWVDDLALRQSIGGQGPHAFGSSSVSAVPFSGMHSDLCLFVFPNMGYP